jgi:hypothetical protein
MTLDPRSFRSEDAPAAAWRGVEALEPRLLLSGNPQPAISIGHAAVTEVDSGQTTSMTFTVNRTGNNRALRNATVVQYRITGADGDNSATVGTDFIGGQGRVRFNRGETSKTITVQVIGDDVYEGAYERLFVTATGGSNYKQLNRAQLGRGPRGVGFIIENDTPPQLSIADASVAEGDSGTTALTFTVSLDQAAGAPVYFIYSTSDDTATAGEDYTAVVNGFGVIPAGQTSTTITVNVLGDTVYENGGVDETFNVTLTNAINATIDPLADEAVGTITEDDAEPELSIDDVTVNESAGTMTFTVTLTNASDQTIEVDYTTGDGTAEDENGDDDYVSDSGTLTFAPGETSKTITITINDDATDEDDETFTVTLSNPVNASIDKAVGTGTITDNDPAPTLSIDNVSDDEANGPFTFTISLSAASGKTVTVTVNSADGTAEDENGDGDYQAIVNQVVTFNPGETSKPVNVTINDDNDVEEDETFTLVLTAPTNATIADGTGLGTIINDD